MEGGIAIDFCEIAILCAYLWTIPLSTFTEKAS